MEKKQIPLRIPSTLYAELMRMAEEDFRSINSEIEYLLTKAVSSRKAKEKIIIEKLITDLSESDQKIVIRNYNNISKQ